MVQFFHPATGDITLTGVMAALGDPVRLAIVRALHEAGEGKSCRMACPTQHIAPSTLSNHFRILREAGLVHTTKRGVENISVLRHDDLDSRFPGLIEQILSHEPA
ncbi:Helix-turn-helix protein [Hartmannibacter diazotrophicus]|uniref:Helix-turn-helix protein n=1 Tax=Hartmannibacter diazotrophicus TaxID=1482074 RepID=A0A2C9DDP3_9HYPH|nr:helix-turn-helix domain-containing protein [Hartmannibacter diazotrophicus]SON58279.1 Helix-turn-helix protein [Hartmannibacter diazotrophicus]